MNFARLLLFLGLLLPAPAFAALHVVATLPSLAALAREVGGADVTVQALSSPRQDPHYVDARPNLVVQLSQADLLIVNGLQLEAGWLPPLLQQARNAKVLPGAAGHLDASTVVQKTGVPQGKIDRANGDIHPGGNPHFLFDPRAGARIAEAMAAALGRLDPAHAANFTSNGAKVAARLHQIATAQTARFDALPGGKRALVAYHESLPYLVEWLHLKQVATLEPKPGIPPNPQHVAGVLQAMRSAGVKVLVQEEFYPRNTAQTLAGLIQGKLVVLPGGARFADGQTYSAHVQALADALYDAMK